MAKHVVSVDLDTDRGECIAKLSATFAGYERRIADLEFERDAAVAELRSKPLGISPDATPITEIQLQVLGLFWNEEHASYDCRHGRLTLHIRVSGHWYADYDSTFGGRCSGYRKLQSMEEVRQLIDLFGCELPDYRVTKA